MSSSRALARETLLEAAALCDVADALKAHNEHTTAAAARAMGNTLAEMAAAVLAVPESSPHYPTEVIARECDRLSSVIPPLADIRATRERLAHIAQMLKGTAQ